MIKLLNAQKLALSHLIFLSECEDTTNSPAEIFVSFAYTYRRPTLSNKIFKRPSFRARAWNDKKASQQDISSHYISKFLGHANIIIHLLGSLAICLFANVWLISNLEPLARPPIIFQNTSERRSEAQMSLNRDPPEASSNSFAEVKVTLLPGSSLECVQTSEF